MILEPPTHEYGEVGLFRSGVAWVRDEMYGLLGPDLEFRRKPTFADHGEFHEGLAWVRREKYGFLDTEGNHVVDLELAHATDFSSGLAAVQTDRGSYGYIDRNGDMAIPARFDLAFPFQGDLAKVGTSSGYGVIDRTGSWILDPIHRSIQIGNDHILVHDERVFLHGPDGSRLSGPFDEFHRFIASRAWVRAGRNWGVVDLAGNWVLPADHSYGKVGQFWNGVSPVMKGGKWGALDLSGKEILGLSYDEVQDFTAPSTWVKRDGLWGSVDLSANEMIPCIHPFEFCQPFSEGLAWFGSENRYGLIDDQGHIRVEPGLELGQRFRRGLAWAKLGAWGLVDSSGDWVLEPAWHNTPSLPDAGKLAQVRSPESFGYIDEHGRLIWAQS